MNAQLLTDPTTGSLDMEKVNTLSHDDVAQWLYDRLHGRERDVPADVRQGEPAFSVFVEAYEQGDRDTRAIIRTSVTLALQSLLSSDTDWSVSATDQLLLLAQFLEESEFLPPVRKLLEREVFAGVKEPVDVEWRLLQTFASLAESQDEAFWMRYFQKDPERFGTLAFSNVLRISPLDALDLLSDLPWDQPITRTQVHGVLSDALDSAGAFYLSNRWLPEHEDMLPAQAAATVREVLEDREIPSKGMSVRPEANEGWALADVIDSLNAEESYWMEKVYFRAGDWPRLGGSVWWTEESSIPARIGKSSARETFLHRAGLDVGQCVVVILYEGLGPNPPHTFKEIGERLSSEKRQFRARDIRSMYRRSVQQTRYYQRRRGGRGGPSLNVREIYNHLAETEDIPQITTDT
jgi:hypothetical protein